MSAEVKLLNVCLACRCPRCGQGDLYKTKFGPGVVESCSHCDLRIDTHDSADAPAFFLMCILATILVPVALYIEFTYEPAFWVHIIVTTALALPVTFLGLRLIKALMIALQFKYRPEDWE